MQILLAADAGVNDEAIAAAILTLSPFDNFTD
jgi:hypothetical protein